tara:strand:- start:292 stop:573 length:282 start_codon:yes stop_codon:yes gene_type:complete
MQNPESVVLGILEYSLKPYAEINNIDIAVLIHDLYFYHTKVSIQKLDEQIREPLTLEVETKINTPDESNVNSGSTKRCRGRPKGSKNKCKDNK